MPLPKALQRLYVHQLFQAITTPLRAVRAGHSLWVRLTELRRERPKRSKVLPTSYRVHNTQTRDGSLTLSHVGTLPSDLDGRLYMAQCLGMPTTFQCGDINLVRLDFGGESVKLKNRRFDTPALIARHALSDTPWAMHFFGYMHWSFAIGAQGYAEGVWLMPDGQLAITSDVERPYLIDPDTLEVTSALGRRDEWLGFSPEPAASLIGKLFPLTNNAQGLFHDHETGEVFMAEFRMKLADPAHPACILKLDANGKLEPFLLCNADGSPLEICQALHEIAVTREHIVLIDAGFATGNDVFFPWLDLPAPKPTTRIHVLERKALVPGAGSVSVQSFEVNLPAIHMFSDYETPDEKLTLYLLHTPFTNVADVIRADDVNLEGQLFAENELGYGTLPPLDVSAIGKHVLDLKHGKVCSSDYLRDPKRTFAPYMFSLPRRQSEHMRGDAAFVMFRGFAKELVPQRVLETFGHARGRSVPLDELVGAHGKNVSPSLCRIDTKTLRIADAYELPERTVCLTLCTLDSTQRDAPGYMIAGVVTDAKAAPTSSGHEYWILRADQLSAGPIAKLFAPELNNATVFHGVYLPHHHGSERRAPRYQLAIRDDYPETEIASYPDAVQRVFEERIYPRYEH